jgi:prophage tail gpP-like protein
MEPSLAVPRSSLPVEYMDVEPTAEIGKGLKVGDPVDVVVDGTVVAHGTIESDDGIPSVHCHCVECVPGTSVVMNLKI